MLSFIHTSDWHIKSHYLYNDNDNRRNAFISAVKDMVRFAITKKVDRFVISGDIFDTHNPSNELIDLFITLLYPLMEAGIKVIAITGNHDSRVSKLGEFNAVSTSSIEKLQSDWLIVVSNSVDVMQEKIGNEIFIYAPWQGELSKLIAGIKNKSKKVLFTHGLMTGAISDTGNVLYKRAELEAALLSQFIYVGLGDIHRMQFVQQNKYGKKICYSGSPVKFTWADRDKQKGYIYGKIINGVSHIVRKIIPDIDFIEIHTAQLNLSAVKKELQGRQIENSYIRIYSKNFDAADKLSTIFYLKELGCYEVEIFDETFEVVKQKNGQDTTNVVFDPLSFCIASLQGIDESKEYKVYIKELHTKYSGSRDVVV